jgi:hypothetical protein
VSFLGFQSLVAAGAIELLGQIGEEALIIQIDDWRRGVKNTETLLFLYNLLRLISLALSKHLLDHIDQSMQVLDKLDKRLKSCTHRKPSQVLTHFAFAQKTDDQVIHLSEGLTNFNV